MGLLKTRLFLFAKNQTRTHEDAQDVLQDAIVKLVEKIRTGEFVGGQRRHPEEAGDLPGDPREIPLHLLEVEET